MKVIGEVVNGDKGHPLVKVEPEDFKTGCPACGELKFTQEPGKGIILAVCKLCGYYYIETN